MNRGEMGVMPDFRPLALAGLALTVLAAAGCSKPAPADGPAPALIAKADPAIASVAPTATGLRVILRLPEPDVAGDTVVAAAHAVRQIARAVQNKATDLPPAATRITVDVYGTDVDKFGKRTFGRMWESDFDIDGLRDFDLKTKGPAAALNTAVDLRIDPGGETPIAAWCMRYPHVAGEYCNMAGN
jgi:hypothetical protein